MKKTLTAIAMFVSSLVSLLASGFQVVEQGASNLGSALAGAVVNANNDASAAYWNPSAATFIDADHKFDVSITYLVPTFEFTGSATDAYGPVTGNDGGNAGVKSIIPNFFYAGKISEDFMVTLAITAPFGLATEYDDGFVGKTHGIKSEITCYEINPSIVYNVTDWLTVAVGASAIYTDADITSDTVIGNGVYGRARAKGHAWTGTFNAGATAKFLETGRVAVSYRHSFSQDLEGSFKVVAPNGMTVVNTLVDCTLDLPSTLTAGVYYRFQDDFWKQFAVMADYSHSRWTSFEKLEITDQSTGAPISRTPEKWRNTNRVSLGMHYMPDWCENLVLRAGMALDQSPIRSTVTRTPRVPDTNRMWVSCGLGYKFERFNIDVAYTHIFFENVHMNHTNPYAPTAGNINGTYSGGADIIAVQMGIKF